MKKFLYLLPSYIFNILEILIVVKIGMMIDLSLTYILIILIPFATIRLTAKKACHYKDWRKCLVWTILVIFTIFVASKVGIVVGVLVSMFNALVLTERGDIRDFGLLGWKGKDNSKYAVMDEYIERNKGKDTLIEFEETLKRIDPVKYKIYIKKFYEKKSFEKISDEIEEIKDQRRITENLDIIYFSFTMFLEMKKELAIN